MESHILPHANYKNIPSLICKWKSKIKKNSYNFLVYYLSNEYNSDPGVVMYIRVPILGTGDGWFFTLIRKKINLEI